MRTRILRPGADLAGPGPKHQNQPHQDIAHAIGKIKQYGIMTRPYGGTPRQFNDELNVVMWLVNFNLIWDTVRAGGAALIEQLTA